MLLKKKLSLIFLNFFLIFFNLKKILQPTVPTLPLFYSWNIIQCQLPWSASLCQLASTLHRRLTTQMMIIIILLFLVLIVIIMIISKGAQSMAGSEGTRAQNVRMFTQHRPTSTDIIANYEIWPFIYFLNVTYIESTPTIYRAFFRNSFFIVAFSEMINNT